MFDATAASLDVLDLHHLVLVGALGGDGVAHLLLTGITLVRHCEYDVLDLPRIEHSLERLVLILEGGRRLARHRMGGQSFPVEDRDQ